MTHFTSEGVLLQFSAEDDLFVYPKPEVGVAQSRVLVKANLLLAACGNCTASEIPTVV